MNTKGPLDPQRLIAGYRLCASTEGNSPSATAIVVFSVNLFRKFLDAQSDGRSLAVVTRHDIRAFIAYLQQTRRFADCPAYRVQDRALSGHTVNCYLRSLRIFYSWLVAEEIIDVSPFEGVKIPRPPLKVIPAFSMSQIDQLLKVINRSTVAGYRDFAVMLTLLDTGIRISELCSLTMEKLQLAEGTAVVLGKGNKERLVPIGKQLQRVLWHYLERYRPEPASARYRNVFLTRAGTPLTRGRVQKIMLLYGRKAQLTGVRCSPHTLRHTAAISFLRNGGDVFSLQRMLGHSSLEMTRRYCELAAGDVQKAHGLASPVDNLRIASAGAAIRSRSGKAPHPLRKTALASMADGSTGARKRSHPFDSRNQP